LLPKDMAFLVETMGAADRGVPMETAAEELRRLTGFKSTGEAMAAFPGFYRYVRENWKAGPPQDPRRYGDWLRLTLSRFLSERMGTTNYMLPLGYFRDRVFPYEMKQVFNPMNPPAWVEKLGQGTTRSFIQGYKNYRAQPSMQEYFEDKQRDDED
jgi:hypothetical protein